MPKETFWDSPTAIEGDDSQPVLTVEWHGDNPGVYLNGVHFDRSGVNRLIRVMRKARNQTDGKDA
jgi:hypothetical protein